MGRLIYRSPPRRFMARRRRACGCRGCFPLPGRGAVPHIFQSSIPPDFLCVLCDFKKTFGRLIYSIRGADARAAEAGHKDPPFSQKKWAVSHRAKDVFPCRKGPIKSAFDAREPLGLFVQSGRGMQEIFEDKAKKCCTDGGGWYHCPRKSGGTPCALVIPSNKEHRHETHTLRNTPHARRPLSGTPPPCRRHDGMVRNHRPTGEQRQRRAPEQ